MSHLKRQQVPKSWPIPRKGTKLVVKPRFNLREGIPLLIFIRDMLKIAQNRKEVKKALNEKKILINGKNAKDKKQGILLLDVITIVPAKKAYKLILNEKGKFDYEETKEKNSKISKIIGKKMLKGKKLQINLMDGRNYLSDIKCKINDSVVIDFKENKIIKKIELKEKAKVLIFAGKHAGKKGIVIKIEGKTAEIETKKEKINVLIKHLMAIE